MYNIHLTINLLKAVGRFFMLHQISLCNELLATLTTDKLPFLVNCHVQLVLVLVPDNGEHRKPMPRTIIFHQIFICGSWK